MEKHWLTHAKLQLSEDQRLLNFYVRIVEKLLDVERCSIFIKDPVNRKIWLKCGTGVVERQIEVDPDNSVAGRVISTGQTAVEENLHLKDGAHKSVQQNTAFVTRDMVCVPVKSVHREEIIGAIQAINKKGDGGFGQEEIETLEEVAYHLKTAIERAYLV